MTTMNYEEHNLYDVLKSSGAHVFTYQQEPTAIVVLLRISFRALRSQELSFAQGV
jgi:hypothetical protein